MGKNILVFSDGTGQAGGLMPDEARSNVYKLFRSTRCGPDTAVDPTKQLTFYDPGLGSKADSGGRKFWGPGRWIYNKLSQATGLGITRNIIDCYAAIVQLWQPGDRIYLFGFSRGAYTARCVGGVLGLCGVPTKMKDGSPLKRDSDSAHAIASEAVKSVYQFGSSIKGDPYKPQRLERAKKFRLVYASGDAEEPNAVPYFVGVWDTVATLGAGWRGLSIVAIVGFALATALVRLFLLIWPYPIGAMAWLFSAGAVLVVCVAIYLFASFRYRQWISLARYRMAFYDTKLNSRVSFARHALSIDENRRDFHRVLWDEDGSERIKTLAIGPERFEQIWFAGNHSDIGGSYAENESRLSDIALQWMAGEAQSLPHSILIDSAYLKPSPSSAGLQHDERKATIARLWPMFARCVRLFISDKNLGWVEGLRQIPNDAPLHPTVMERFELPSVLAYDVTIPYRPEALRHHQMVKKYY
jgi:uncharacterized protein (DUF2235 family)